MTRKDRAVFSAAASPFCDDKRCLEKRKNPRAKERSLSMTAGRVWRQIAPCHKLLRNHEKNGQREKEVFQLGHIFVDPLASPSIKSSSLFAPGSPLLASVARI